MALTGWARRQGIRSQPVCNRFHAGTLPAPAVGMNQRAILVSPWALATLDLYARVSPPTTDGQTSAARRPGSRSGWHKPASRWSESYVRSRFMWPVQRRPLSVVLAGVSN